MAEVRFVLEDAHGVPVAELTLWPGKMPVGADMFVAYRTMVEEIATDLLKPEAEQGDVYLEVLTWDLTAHSSWQWQTYAVLYITGEFDDEGNEVLERIGKVRFTHYRGGRDGQEEGG